MKIILLGMPGTGKGTIGGLVKERHGFEHISTGDLFREAISNKTEAGMKAKEFYDKGSLVPDEITLELLKEKIQQLGEDAKILFDGYPRNIEQAKVLKEIVDIDKVINFSLDKERLVKRLSGRRNCPDCKRTYNIFIRKPKEEGKCDDCGTELVQRDDDKEEVIGNRFETYNKETAPLIEFYDHEGILQSVELTDELEDNYSKIKDALGLD